MPPRVLKSTFVLFPVGSTGDVKPFAGVGAILRDQGHRVVLVANSYFESFARRSGLEFISTGPEDAYFEMVRHSEAPPGKRLKIMFETMLERMVLVYRIIERHFVAAETILVAPPLAFGARLAQEKLGLPLATLNIETTNFRSAYPALEPLLPTIITRPLRRIFLHATDHWILDPLLLPRINAFRSELGLQPITHAWREWPHSQQLSIGLFPNWFAPPRPDWPLQTCLTGFPLFDEQGSQDLPDRALQFLDADDAPIVFTLGTGARFARRFFEVSMHACLKLRRRGIFLTPFREWVPAGLPDDVAHFDYLPLSLVLRRAALLVHHGGIGTMAEGFRAGVPQLVVPVIFDQPENAAKLVRFGAGAAISPRRYTVNNAVRLLRRLLTSPRIAATCRDLALRFEGTDPMVETCRLIESLRHGAAWHATA